MLARRPRRRPTRPLLVALALLVCGAVTIGGPAGGLIGPGAARADGPDPATGPGKLVLVLDSSGSMKEPAAGGETKIAAARTALRSVVSGLPADQPVGLRVYGATVFSRSDSGACTDSQLKVPVDTDNREQLLSAVASYKPYGETPIGYSLQQASHDLGSTGKRSIVLVSDGEPTCAPDPCEVARKLVAGGIDLKIDVVGLDVGPRARRSLQCIAEKGHGTYYDVSGSRDFAQSLQKVATRAARPFATIGQAVSGADSATDAPTISNGDWQDRTNGTAERYYQVKRAQSGSTVHFSAAFRDPDTTVFNTVELKTSDGQLCGASGAVEQLATRTLVSAATAAGPVGATGDYDLQAPCATAPVLIAKVTYAGKTRGVPVEIRVTELPRVDDVSGLPQPVHDLRWVAPAPATPRGTQGGSSFDDAPLLVSGRYRDNIVQGETLTYQVDVDWGQQLTAQVALPPLGRRRAAAATGSPLVAVQVFSPPRAPVGSSVDSHNSQAFLTTNAQTLGTVAGPVAFLNGSASSSALQGADVAGRYTVTVFLDKKPGGRSVPVPFTLDLGVSGTPHGKPAFATAPVSPDSANASPSASGAASSTDAGGTGDGDGTKAVSADGGTTSGFPTGAVLAGLGVLALVAAAGVTLRSVRQRTG